jgi:hypothetical protein
MGSSRCRTAKPPLLREDRGRAYSYSRMGSFLPALVLEALLRASKVTMMAQLRGSSCRGWSLRSWSLSAGWLLSE